MSIPSPSPETNSGGNSIIFEAFFLPQITASCFVVIFLPEYVEKHYDIMHRQYTMIFIAVKVIISDEKLFSKHRLWQFNCDHFTKAVTSDKSFFYLLEIKSFTANIIRAFALPLQV